MQSRKITPLKELISKALYGAEDDDSSDDDSDSQEEDEKQQTDDKASPDKVSPEYVEKLRKENAAKRIKAKDANERADKLQAELDEIRKAEMTDLEKAQTDLEETGSRVEVAEARAVAAEAKLQSVTISNAVTLAAIEANFQDPADALSMISQDDIIDDEGNVSAKTVKARLKSLADKKPYLVKKSGSGSGDGGARGSAADEDTFQAKQKKYLEQMTTSGGRVPV